MRYLRQPQGPSSEFNWNKVDIRTISIVQDPGPSNPLGQIKFLFPNKHDVYMHDTPTKHLFESTVRTFSHGCIRVRNPRKLAEVVFGEDQGWAASDVASRLQSFSSPVNNRVPLAKRIPVHNVYFTVVASADGGLANPLNDIYGHDKRYSEALAGKSIAMIAARDPALALKKKNDELRDLIAAVSPKPRRKMASLQKAAIKTSSGWAPWKKTAGSSPPSIFLWLQ